MLEKIEYSYFEQRFTSRQAIQFVYPDEFRGTNILKKTIDCVSLLNHLETVCATRERDGESSANHGCQVLFLYDIDGCSICIRKHDRKKGRYTSFGFLFHEKWSRLVWYYLDRMVWFVRKKGGDTEDAVFTLDFNAVSEKGDNVQEFDGYDADIAGQIKQYITTHDLCSFAVGCGLYGAEQYIRTIPLDGHIAETRPENRVLSLEEIKPKFSDCNMNYGVKDGYIANDYLSYRIPTLKDRPRIDGYFKERKQIKEDIKNNKAYWTYTLSSTEQEKVVATALPETGLFLIDDMLSELKRDHRDFLMQRES